MALKLYNTRTRSIEAFEPLNPQQVRIYVCGLTPSAEAHLGHARSFLFFDVLRRYLVHCGYDVHYVKNVTDIDDRSVNRARETGEDWHEIVMTFYRSFQKSMRLLDVAEPDDEPYATEFIPQIIAMIEELIAKGHAYVSKDGVYYRVASFPHYGRLSNRNIEELESGARIEVDEFKDDPLDFALWKFAKPGEPKWPSPWGEGRPGWHIECSAMSRVLLDPQGNGFDIHGGGADLIFPHHENEIAQSEPLMHRPPMANFWVHGGLLQFDNRKMSKSLGNFEPLFELLERHDPQAIRLLFLQTGYSKVMNFTEESVRAATVALSKLKELWKKFAVAAGSTEIRIERPMEQTPLMTAIEAALDDDMNTSAALSKIFDAEKLLLGGDHHTRFYTLTYALNLLGLTPKPAWLEEKPRELPSDFLERLAAETTGVHLNGATPERAVEAVIAARLQARQEKNWAESDRLRDALARCGVALKDSKDGTTWTVAE